MLRRIPSAELPEFAAPSVRSLRAPEARDLERDLSRARAAADALRMLRREFRAHLQHASPALADRLGLSVDALAEWLEGELARFASDRGLQLHLHPSDADLLENHGTFKVLRDSSEALELVRDPGVTPGGCILVSDRGTLDARVETKLGLLLSVLAQSEAP